MPSRRFALLAGLLAAASVLVYSQPAEADRMTSQQYFDEGRQAYELGDYSRAAAKFEEAYAEYSAHEYLFNIAQAYRKLGDCPKALTFYTKFLEGPAQPAVREIAEENAAELRTICPEPEEKVELRPPPPPEEPEQPEGRGNVVAMVEGGLASYDIGAVNTPVVADLRLAGFYVLAELPVEVRAGLSAELNPMKYTSDRGEATTYLSTLQVEGSLAYAAESAFRLALELGAGTMMVSSLEPGNPFIDGGGASGIFLLPALRIALRAELALSEAVSVYVSPAFGYASTSKRFAPDISGLQRFTAVLGLALRP